MAKAEQKSNVSEIEREYNIPLRKEFQKVPRYKKSKKATTAVREFLVKHMKSENVRLDNSINELIWQNGAKNPPHHILVRVKKESDGSVFAELKNLPKKKKSSILKKKERKEKKIEKAKTALDKVKEGMKSGTESQVSAGSESSDGAADTKSSSKSSEESSSESKAAGKKEDAASSSDAPESVSSGESGKQKDQAPAKGSSQPKDKEKK